MSALENYHNGETWDHEDAADMMLRLGFASESFIKLAKMIYGDGIFDRVKFNSLMDNLALDLGVKLPHGELNITRRRSELMDIAIPSLHF